MELLGFFHFALSLAALVIGPVVFFRPKGDRRHRQLGYVYVGLMLLLNGSALAIYDLTGGWNILHGFAVISLLTLAAGFVPVFLRRPAGAWLNYHYHFMCWSYVGLVAAGLSEVFTRAPRHWPHLRTLLPENYFWLALNVCLFVCVAAGVYLIAVKRVGYPKARERTAV